MVMTSRYTTTAKKQVRSDLNALKQMVAIYNTLPADDLNNYSIYEGFVEGVLRETEDDYLKYNIEVNNGDDISNNSELGAEVFSEANASNSPIKIYYYDEDGSKIYTDSFLDAPQRGTPIYIELTGYLYVPMLSKYFYTDDYYSKKYHRKLIKIPEEAVVIGEEKYKGREGIN